MSDFYCKHQEPSTMEGIVICNIGKFGGAPAVDVCLNHCKGAPEVFDAKIRSIVRIKPLCKYLGEDNKTCTDETVISKECPKVTGGSCRHYLPDRFPDCGCNKNE